MFSIIISEKGGAERRENFERTEINVGRVQGNDLMLPKGNVSKHHARLIFREGRFIVTDLKSTNGTYVNGRKIAQATIVREGDKIYIGDFVLRLDGDASSRKIVDGQRESESGAAVARAEVDSVGQAVPHFALERDPDDSEGEVAARLPVPPPIPSSSAPGTQMPLGQRGAGVGTLEVPEFPQEGSRARTGPQGPAVEVVASSRLPTRELPEQSARKLALVSLLDRVAEIVDLTPLSLAMPVDNALCEAIEQAARKSAEALVGVAPNIEQTIDDLLRELLALGPVGPLLEDPDVTQIACFGPDRVMAWRGPSVSNVDPVFSSDIALARVITRLAMRAERPLQSGETVVERRLVGGVRVAATLPPTSNVCTLTIRRPSRFHLTMEDIVRLGAMPRAIAEFVEQCWIARANVLLCGTEISGVGAFMAGLAAVPFAERLAVLRRPEEFDMQETRAVSFDIQDAREDEDVLRLVAQLAPDRLLLAPLVSSLTALVLEQLAGGRRGVLAAVLLPTARQAVTSLVAQFLLARPGLSPDVARECVGESFDLVLEVDRFSDGRDRVARIFELAGSDAKGPVLRELFGQNEKGELASTGVVPRFVKDYAVRGAKFDAATFKKGAR